MDCNTPDIQHNSWWISLAQPLNVTGPAGLHFRLLCQEPTTLRSNSSAPRNTLGGTQCTDFPGSRIRINSPKLMLYPFTDSTHIGFLVCPQRMCSFMPQLPEQLSSSIKPGPATLVNCIQCPLGDKAHPHLMVGSKTHRQHQGW